MMTTEMKKEIEGLGAFEISSKMIEIATENQENSRVLNAGRGNPNWINTEGRLAFSRLIEFGVSESRRTFREGNLAGAINIEGIGDRFKAFFYGNYEVDRFLSKAIDYCVDVLNMDIDKLVKEFVDGAIGNDYPVPSRCLIHTEKILNMYLEKELYSGAKLADNTNVFPTEGGTSAICYTFNSLKENGLVNLGDKIAINIPIFTPYLQIPELQDYEMIEVDLISRKENNGEIDIDELEKLKNTDIKALFFVNPSNPVSRAIDKKTLDAIKNLLKERPDLIIITDDVYGTFVEDFKSIYSVAPYNTLLVYSYSKLYGSTGWRIGAVALHEDNVFDELISKLPEEKKKELDKRYGLVTLDTRNMKFIDRMVADSRSVGLYHTSGLSTPQQIQMALFSLTALVCNDEDRYIKKSKDIVENRYHNLLENLGIEEDNSRENSKYYSLIDLYKLSDDLYGKNFVEYLKENGGVKEFLLKLAKKSGIVLMEGVGFGAEPGTLRISLANLPNDAYKKIAEAVLDLLAKYKNEFNKNQLITI